MMLNPFDSIKMKQMKITDYAPFNCESISTSTLFQVIFMIPSAESLFDW